MDRKTTEIKSRGKLDKRGRIIFAGYTAAVLALTVFAETCFAANDPLAVVNNLSTFIFSLIRAIGLILLGFGIILGVRIEIRLCRFYSCAIVIKIGRYQ